MWWKRPCLTLLAWLGLASCFPALGGGVAITPDATRIALSDRLEVFRDGAGVLKVGEVAERPSAFRPITRAELAPGFDRGVYWLRLNLHNPGPVALTRWLAVGHPRLQSVVLFKRDAAGWHSENAGTAVPLAYRAIPSARAVFPLHLPAGETSQFLVRVRSITALDMDTTLWEPTAYLDAEARSQITIFLALGGALLAFSLALFVFALLREPPYLYFALLQGFAAILEMARNGLLQQYLWPPELPFPPLTIPVAAAGTALSLLFFMRRFVALERWPRAWSILYKVLATAVILTAAGCAFDYGLWIRFLSLVGLASLLVFMVTALKAWRQGLRTARFLVFSFSFFWLSEGLRQLSNQGLFILPEAMNFSLSWSLLVMTPLILLALTARTAELRVELAESRQRHEAKSAFLARVSHELRAPLNTIIGFARMLRRNPSRLSLNDGTEGIEKSGLRLLGLIDELLDEASLQSGRLGLAPQPLRMGQWLDNLTRAATLTASESGNEFICERRGIPELVMADGARLQQVLDNLIGNANRHTRNGKLYLRCEARPTANPGDAVRVDFSLTDSGEGIPPEDLERVFEPFVQIHPSAAGEKRRSGIGLGLPIARELVRLMGGEIAVASTAGKGSTFSFSLCFPLAEATPASFAEFAPASFHEAPGAAGMRVLVVDDDPYVAVLLSNLLGEAGYLARAVASGNEAAALLDGGEPWDAVLTDQDMPHGDGWFVLRCARTSHPELPVILFSATAPSRPGDIPGTMDFDAVLLKPSKPEEILAVLAGLTTGVAPLSRSPGGEMKWPDQARLEELAGLVRGGEITGIEEWCERLDAACPECSAFTGRVRKALLQLDFPALAELVAQPLEANVFPESCPHPEPDKSDR